MGEKTAVVRLQCISGRGKSAIEVHRKYVEVRRVYGLNNGGNFFGAPM